MYLRIEEKKLKITVFVNFSLTPNIHMRILAAKFQIKIMSHNSFKMRSRIIERDTKTNPRMYRITTHTNPQDVARSEACPCLTRTDRCVQGNSMFSIS